MDQLAFVENLSFVENLPFPDVLPYGIAFQDLLQILHQMDRLIHDRNELINEKCRIEKSCQDRNFRIEETTPPNYKPKIKDAPPPKNWLKKAWASALLIPPPPPRG
jgi:hypothetical protein